MFDPLQLEAYLYEHIPISRHLGVQVIEAAADQVRLGAPLAPNLNHRQTGFGGSIAALAILAGWSLLWVRLREQTAGHNIVIQNSSLSYLAPVVADFAARCTAPAPEQWEPFMRTFTLRGRARIPLDVEVLAEEQRVATFRGRYVVLRDGTAR